MKNKDELNKLKEEYNKIEIPKDLDDVIEKAFKESKKEVEKKSYKRNIRRWCASAATIGAIIVSINISPTFADNLENIPVIGGIIKVVNLNNYRINRNGYDISIDVPEISTIDSKDLEYKLNEEFKKEGKEEYKKYENELKNIEKSGEKSHKYGKVWYEILNENDNVISIVRYNYESQGSSDTTRKIYNVDKKDKEILTLKGMFGNNDYVDVISKNILKQMKERAKKDPLDSYFVDSSFKIRKDQDFYINNKNELVICFDKYEVAPGSSGLVEFTIPTEIVNNLMK
ncbi:DUF3298 domain-containing protein [Peptacetobacter sp.]|uniref:DUF3298 domain-containing protein n=1 Tax=Peptacetobacter sp. TaxID=2991975 RepID=UPI0026236634|nr:DUF3298 domain-containing protein [Peptacetobacter sp.]